MNSTHPARIEHEARVHINATPPGSIPPGFALDSRVVIVIPNNVVFSRIQRVRF